MYSLIKEVFIHLKLFFIFLVSVFFVSCASAPNDFRVEYESESEYEVPSVTLSVVPEWSRGIVPGFYRFICTFINHSDKAVKVVWDESSINYKGNSFVPFIDGQKYSKAQEPMSPAVIPKGGRISKSIYSSEQPYFSSYGYGGWYMTPISANEVQLLFMIKSNSQKGYITATVKPIIGKD